jgi:opacity protein-like surface antigen
MKYFAISAVLLVSTLAAPSVRADDDFKPFGYLTVGASRSAAVFDSTLDDAFTGIFASGAQGSSHIGDTWGANAHAGYRFHKFLAAEVEYEWMKDFHMRVDGIDIGSMQTQVATANLKVVAPFGAFEPYFLAGAGMIFTTVDKAFALDYDVGNGQFTMKFGAGVDYWLTENMSLSLGAEVVTNSAKITGPPGTTGDGEGIDYVTGQFGFGFRF